jgi:hypothetical protein
MRNTRKRNVIGMIICCCLLSLASVCLYQGKVFSKPPSAETTTTFSKIQKIYAQQQISDADARSFATTLDDPAASQDAKLLAALALAYASDADSLKQLQDIARASNSALAGVAQFAIDIRSLAQWPDKERFNGLVFYLGREQRAETRLFLANRLAVEYQDVSFLPLYLAAKNETDPTAQCDMLYYLSRTKDTNRLQLLLNTAWDERGMIPENILAILVTITPGRQQDPGRTDYTVIILKSIRAKLQH